MDRHRSCSRSGWRLRTCATLCYCPSLFHDEFLDVCAGLEDVDAGLGL